MALSFLLPFAASLQDFWQGVPEKPRAYILVANRKFVYSQGESAVFYIGQASNLRSRLLERLKFAQNVRKNTRRKRLYWARYGYAGAFGSLYATVVS